jgi:hypothetical protein
MWLHLLGHTCHLLYNLNAIHNRQNHPKDRFKHSQPQSYKPTSELVNPYHLKAWCRDWKSCKTVLRQQERSWNICNVLSHWSSSYVLYPRPTSPWKHRGLHVNDKSGVWLWDIKDGCGHYICLRYIYIYICCRFTNTEASQKWIMCFRHHFLTSYAGSWHLGQSSLCQKRQTCLLDLKLLKFACPAELCWWGQPGQVLQCTLGNVAGWRR